MGASSVQRSTMRERLLQCIVLRMVERDVHCVRSLMEFLSLSLLTSIHFALHLCNILFLWKFESYSSYKCCKTLIMSVFLQQCPSLFTFSSYSPSFFTKISVKSTILCCLLRSPVTFTDGNGNKEGDELHLGLPTKGV